ncbi:MAG: hypothetical protein AAGA31_20935, partial [Bacteroidota bacterium]
MTALLIAFTATLSGQLIQHFQELARTQVQYLVDNNEHLSTAETEDGALLFHPSSEIPLEEQLDALRQQLVNLPVFSQATWTL